MSTGHARGLAVELLSEAAKLFNMVSQAFLGTDRPEPHWQWALLQDAVAVSIISKQSREEFLKAASEQYDALIAARDKFNENNPYPICPGCGMRHEPHGDEEIPRTTH